MGSQGAIPHQTSNVNCKLVEESEWRNRVVVVVVVG